MIAGAACTQRALLSRTSGSPQRPRPAPAHPCSQARMSGVWPCAVRAFTTWSRRNRDQPSAPALALAACPPPCAVSMQSSVVDISVSTTARMTSACPRSAAARRHITGVDRLGRNLGKHVRLQAPAQGPGLAGVRALHVTPCRSKSPSSLDGKALWTAKRDACTLRARAVRCVCLSRRAAAPRECLTQLPPRQPPPSAAFSHPQGVVPSCVSHLKLVPSVRLAYVC